MLAETHQYELTILEGHLDSFGHVNNAVYLSLFEEARWDLITRNGYGLDRILVTNLGPVILEAQVKFRRELRLRDRITITTRVTEYRRRIGKIHQEIHGSSGELCTLANFTFGLFDTVKRELVPPNEDWLRAVGVSKL